MGVEGRKVWVDMVLPIVCRIRQSHTCRLFLQLVWMAVVVHIKTAHGTKHFDTWIIFLQFPLNSIVTLPLN